MHYPSVSYCPEGQHVNFKVVVKSISRNRNIHLVTRSLETNDPTSIPPCSNVTGGIKIATFTLQCEVYGTVFYQRQLHTDYSWWQY